MANVTGGTGSDTLTGTGSADSISGWQGNDTINAGGGADTIYGGSGNDTVDAGSANDLIYGDSDRAATWAYTVYNKNFSSANNQALSMESGATVAGSGLTTGFDVNALAQAARGSVVPDQNDFGVILTSTFTAGAGGTYRFATSSDDGSTIRIFDANGNLLNFANQEGGTLSYMNNDFHQGLATRYGDVTLAAGQSYRIEIRYWENEGQVGLSSTVTPPGGTATNLLTSGAIGVAPNTGNDSLLGGDGNDTIFGEAGNDQLFGGNNNDTLFGGTGNDSLQGDSGNDSLVGDEGIDSLFGGAGLDSLYGGADGDSLAGGDATDSLFGGDGGDSLYGDAANDTLYGDGGNDSLYGGLDNDSLFGGDGLDSLYGDAGNDSLYGDAGNDSLFGGDNTDSLFGGIGDDQLYGGAANDSLFAGEGADQLFGGEGADTLEGQEGNDTIYGDAGADSMNGGQGQDYVDYSASGAAVNVNFTTGSGSGGDAAGDIYAGVDGIFGSAFNDTLIGYDDEGTTLADPYTNIFYGNGGNDSMEGRGGGDILFGGADNDSIYGGAGADSVSGGTGNDSLFGGDDNDQMFGGDGNDTLNGGAGSDILQGGLGSDRFIVTIGDTVDGNEDPDNLEEDVLDLLGSGFTKSSTNIIFNDPDKESGTVQFLDGTTVIGTLSFDNIERIIPCFTAGSQIVTRNGLVSVESLKPGEQVLTRDNGYQTLRWLGLRNLSGAELAAQPTLQPVSVQAGALGYHGPTHDMLVSPQHRILIADAQSDMLFGAYEVLVPALYLVGRPGVSRAKVQEVTYVHILFDQHEIVCVDGAWSESFQPAARMLSGMDQAARDEVLTLFPSLASESRAFPAARMTLKAHEAKVLLLAG